MLPESWTANISQHWRRKLESNCTIPVNSILSIYTRWWGAYLVAKELGITDRLVLEAIAAHSYAGNGRH